mmetsp:Transcript_32960/g.69370  ORF Transcript_32960/g.69370 Transcript_32960/m.69370 type:complete len:152 (-) Transcript_32960:3329-3784(-)
MNTMRFLLFSPLLIAVSSHAHTLRGTTAANNMNPADLAQNVLSSSTPSSDEHERALSASTLLSGFAPLTCNQNITQEPCVTWTSKAFDPTAGVVTIPCGECVTMDDNELLLLENGLNIEGKLMIPDGTKITISTPFLFVQGILEMTSTRAT